MQGIIAAARRALAVDLDHSGRRHCREGDAVPFCAARTETVASSAVETDAWHHRSDAITSAAAFIGISIALIGGKGYEAADNWAAMAAACVIAFNGWLLLRPALNELMDRSPDRE